MLKIAKCALVAVIAALLVACGGGGTATPEPSDKTSLAYKQWLWEFEGGDPAEFTVEKFCASQPEHCNE